MRNFFSRGPVARLFQSHKHVSTKNSMVVLCIIIAASILLSSCGSVATGQTLHAGSTPTATLAPTPTAIPTQAPTPKPTPKPTPRPTPTPTFVPQPTQPPSQPAPAILDVRPSSMSIVGHLDCNRSGAFICFARVLSGTGNRSNLNWYAYTNVPGGVTFSPVRGVLAPGQSVLITITVPFNACIQGLFFFQGPVNTHTISWAC
jgi:hypothetical protein